MDHLTKLQSALSDRYAVLREIGAGGMATVYLAEDLKHRRKVALKVLQSELAAVLGPERFLSEINVTANLQHPHLLPLFDSGEADGLLFYVMPYVEGESLRARLDREKQLPVDEAIRITVAAASALDYAHRHGVVHRDLKPENILLHDGHPLVSDFGIALAVSNAGGTRVTQTGLSLGTPQYMSPEQATGDRNIDARSDIYSLAAVLYEMLTGEPPHTGATVQAIIARVLTDRPRPARGTRDTVPMHVDATLQKALAKLPADRFATALQFAEALQNPRSLTVPLDAAAVEPSTVMARPTWQRRARSLAPWVVAGIGIAIGVASVMGPRSTENAVAARFPIILPDGVEVSPPNTTFAVSPDGRTLAFTVFQAGRFMVYARELDDVQAKPIPGTEGGLYPFFSHDGTSIGFHVGAAGQIRRVPVAGGTPRTIANTARFFGASWGLDDMVVFAGGSELDSGLMRVSASGGQPQPLTTLDTLAELRHMLPEFLPDGKTLVFVRLPIEGEPQLAVAGSDGSIRNLNIAGTRPQFVSPGSLLFNLQDGNVMAVRFNPRNLKTDGQPELLLQNVRLNVFSAAAFAASPNGTLAYDVGLSNARIVLVDRHGVATALSEEARNFRLPRASRDGNRIVLQSATTSGENDIWLFDRRTGTFTRFTTGGVHTDPVWSPDGSRIAYGRGRMPDGVDVLWQRVDGGGSADTLVAGAGSQWPWAFTPDGQTLVYDDRPSGQPIRIMATRINGDSAPRAIAQSQQYAHRLGKLSPDGRWLAYTSNESGRTEVYVRPFYGPGGKVQISTDGGDQPVWSRDGRELYYRDGTKLIAAAIRTTPEVTVSARTKLFDDRFQMSNATNYDVLPDGRFVMLQSSTGANAQMFVIVNWKAAVRQ